MIGWYVHHVGAGHLHRARAVIAELSHPVVVLSSAPRPADWPGDWVSLARDDDLDVGEGDDVTAAGQLHWVPTGHPGVAARAAQVSAWIDRARPDLLVADVSVEVALLARLHGTPVVTVVQPGRRTDDAHLLGYRVSRGLLAAWPAGVDGMLPGLPEGLRRRVEHVGGLSRWPVGTPGPRRPGPHRVAVLLGAGGGGPSPAVLERARRSAPKWSWTVLGGAADRWVADPAAAVRDADVVVCQAGQNVVAEVASVRRPAVVVPAPRPHDEQHTTARALASGGWPVVVQSAFSDLGWDSLLHQALALDGDAWSGWCDGEAATRAAAVIEHHAGVGTAS